MKVAQPVIRTLLLSAILCSPAMLQAQGLFNTGQNVSNVGGVFRDNAWTVQANPFGGGAVAAYVVSGPPGNWEPNNTVTSPFYQYISASTSGSLGSAQTYLYSTSFNLTGYSLPTVSFSFRCAKDNTGTTIRLNSVSLFTGNVCNSDNVYTFGAPATINTGFVQGVNSLTFETAGDGTTDGLMVSFSNFQGSIGNVVTTPEPSSMVLVGAGVLLLGVVTRRRGTNVSR